MENAILPLENVSATLGISVINAKKKNARTVGAMENVIIKLEYANVIEVMKELHAIKKNATKIVDHLDSVINQLVDANVSQDISEILVIKSNAKTNVKIMENVTLAADNVNAKMDIKVAHAKKKTRLVAPIIVMEMEPAEYTEHEQPVSAIKGSVDQIVLLNNVLEQIIVMEMDIAVDHLKNAIVKANFPDLIV